MPEDDADPKKLIEEKLYRDIEEQEPESKYVFVNFECEHCGFESTAGVRKPEESRIKEGSECPNCERTIKIKWGEE